MKKFRLIILTYIITRTALSFFGLWGDGDPQKKEFLLHYFTNSDITTSKAYFLQALVPFTFYHLMAILLLWFLFAKKYDIRVLAWLKKYMHSAYLRAFSFFLLLFTGIFFLRLPFIIYAGYFRDKIFGLMAADFTTWFLRLLSSACINIILTTFALSLLLLIIKKYKYYLLLLPFAFFILASSYAIFYPRVIIPLFYTTIPISDTHLADDINELARRAEINVHDIRIMNTSKYSSAINAHFTGLGPEKSIYLYNTLLHNFNHQEILSVLSHEIGHYKENHVLLGILLASCGVCLFLICINSISRFCFKKNFRTLLRDENYLALFMLTSILLFFSTPVEQSISRIMERRADAYSLRLTHDPGASISMRIKSARENKLLLLPHPFYRWFFYSHPSVLQRISHAAYYVNE